MSACSPAVLDKQGVGMIMNTHFEDGKLKAEAWLEQSRVDRIDNRVTSAIARQEMLELSTGLFSDAELTPGTWNGKQYDKIARNIVPDHLAVLPDQSGACSIEDGAGFLRTNLEGGVKDAVNRKCEDCGKLTINKIEGKEKTMKKTQELVDGLIKNATTHWTQDDSVFLLTLNEDQLEKMAPVIAEVAPEPPAPSPESTENVLLPPAPAPEVPKKPLTLEEYVSNAPAEMREVLSSGLSVMRQQKAAYIESIIANEANTFTKEGLETQSLEYLSAIAQLATNGAKPQEAVPMFHGQQEVICTTQNLADTEPLVMPEVFPGE